MRNVLGVLLAVLMISMGACSNDDTTRPQPSSSDGTIQGQIGGSDFEYEVSAGEPGSHLVGPFLLRGTNLHYDDQAGALVVDLTVRNLGSVAHHEPIGLTFVRLDPDEVTLLNPDNDIHGDGAAIVFHFANDDGVWTPGETSLPRTVQFGVSKGVSIAFVAHLDIGDDASGGTIAGRVWNDANKNGTMDDGEPGIAGVGIHLLGFSGGDSVATREFAFTQTGPDSHYAFHGLRAGGYVVSKGPSTVDFFPTTPTEIHVLLVGMDGGVSSYLHANFGCVPQIAPPHPVAKRLLAQGMFHPPDTFAASHTEFYACDNIVPGTECSDGILRGTIAEIRDGGSVTAVRMMTTWFLVYPERLPGGMEVGQRVEVYVRRNEQLVAGMINVWRAPHDEIDGPVERVEDGPNGLARVRVLGTWITLPNVTVGQH